MKTGRPKRWLLKTGVVLASTLVALGAAELVLRVISPRWDGKANALFDRVDPSWNRPDRELGFVRQPHLRWEGRVFEDPLAHHVLYETDKNGFRNPESLTQAPIVVIGDSFVEAGQVPRESTFAARLGHKLQEKTANLGRGFYGPQQELVVLKRYAKDYDPKWVVWCFFEGNDIQDANRYREFREQVEKGGDWWDEGFFRGLEISKMWGGFRDRMKRANENRAYRFGLVGEFKSREGGIEDVEFCYRYRPNLTEKHAQAWEQTQATLQEASGYCLENGWKFLVVYLPIKIRAMGPSTEFDPEGPIKKYLKDGKYDHTDNLAAHVEAYCQQIDVPFVNCLAPLRDAANRGERVYVLRWDNHLDIEGHEVVATTIAEALETHGWSQSGESR